MAAAFGPQLSLARRHDRLPHHRHLVLVHRSIYRAAYARRQKPHRGPSWRRVRRIPQGAPGFHFSGPGHDRFRPAQERHHPSAVQRRWLAQRRHRVPHHGHLAAAHGPARSCGGRPAFSPDELTGLPIQLLRHPLHLGCLQTSTPQPDGKTPGQRRSFRHRHRRRPRHRLDSRDEIYLRRRTLHLPPECPGLSGAAHHRGVSARPVCRARPAPANMPASPTCAT